MWFFTWIFLTQLIYFHDNFSSIFTFQMWFFPPTLKKYIYIFSLRIFLVNFYSKWFFFFAIHLFSRVFFHDNVWIFHMLMFVVFTFHVIYKRSHYFFITQTIFFIHYSFIHYSFIHICYFFHIIYFMGCFSHLILYTIHYVLILILNT